ncbi:9316_t:CDS:2 [Funneliformis mosseae]|uniref:9316_t:CDS:1 n=1 Tax=Funneliformis mosseae TaxID=27381 RepID=A0A9N8V9P3_FUNMO|nr:9316_t:CDS:2 [Funneliformis mosseae]
MGSGNDLGMDRKNGGEELEDPNYLQRNSTTIQTPMSNNGTDIKCDYIINHNYTGRAVHHIFEELSKEDNKEEKNEGKNVEKNEGKNEETKGKKKRKKQKKRAKTEEIHMSTPGSAIKLDEHSEASPQQTSHSRERVVEDQSQKNNSLFRRYIPRTTRQSSPGQDSTEKRLASFPERSERELYGNDSLDSPSKAGAQYSNQYTRTINVRTKQMSELSKLPDYICEHLDKNNRFGFHQITNDDSLDFVDEVRTFAYPAHF